MVRFSRYLIIILSLLTVSFAKAAFSPLSVSILPPVQFPGEDFSITGARLSVIYGQHRDIYGFDFGLVGNITEQDFVGTGISGIFNWTRGNTTILGVQAAGITNVNTSKINVVGVQLAAILNYNTGEGSVTGLQLALGNLGEHLNIYGIQAGIYNKAQAVYGVQIGLINYTESLHGIQIGLVNFNHKGLFKVSPILNVGF